MVHLRDKDETEAPVKKISEELSLKDDRVLFSNREFKKKRVKYCTDYCHAWYRDFTEEVFSS